jgi:hypothetical protein
MTAYLQGCLLTVADRRSSKDYEMQVSYSVPILRTVIVLAFSVS